jgi:hypothetical protein
MSQVALITLHDQELKNLYHINLQVEQVSLNQTWKMYSLDQGKQNQLATQ